MSDIERVNRQLGPLVQRVMEGDREALGPLASACHGLVHRWALGVTGDPDDADDVTQEVLMRLQGKLDSYREDARFTTWLYRLTRNAAVDFGRARSRRKRLAEHPRLVPTTPATPGQLDAIHRSDLTSLVSAFFEMLPEQQRQVFDLVDLQGMSPAEVSEMIEMNASTVRAHLFKARRAIRQRILLAVPSLDEGVST